MGMKAMQRTDEELDQLLEDLLRELKGLAVEQIAVMVPDRLRPREDGG